MSTEEQAAFSKAMQSHDQLVAALKWARECLICGYGPCAKACDEALTAAGEA